MEPCGICDRDVPFDDTVHVLVHTKSEAGVIDHYVCRDCYEEHLQSLFE